MMVTVITPWAPEEEDKSRRASMLRLPLRKVDLLSWTPSVLLLAL